MIQLGTGRGLGRFKGLEGRREKETEGRECQLLRGPRLDGRLFRGVLVPHYGGQRVEVQETGMMNVFYSVNK